MCHDYYLVGNYEARWNILTTHIHVDNRMGRQQLHSRGDDSTCLMEQGQNSIITICWKIRKPSHLRSAFLETGTTRLIKRRYPLQGHNKRRNTSECSSMVLRADMPRMPAPGTPAEAAQHITGASSLFRECQVALCEAMSFP